jgi:hypothetical protein
VRGNCAPTQGLISFLVMIDTRRKLPAPPADSWSIDLASLGARRFMILAAASAGANVRWSTSRACASSDATASTRLRPTGFPTERAAVI